MNKQILRQEIVADLDRLLQAAETKYDETRGGIGKKTDSSGRTFYMNLNKGRRATTKEWQAVFKEDSSNADIQKRQARDAKANVDAGTFNRNAAEGLKKSKKYIDDMPEDNPRKKELQGVLEEQMKATPKVGLGELLQDKARYKKEAVEAFAAQATDALYADYAGVHDYLTNKEDRQKFNENVVNTINALREGTVQKATGFANTVMDGIGSMLTNAENAIKTQATNAKAAMDKQWSELQANPEFQKRAGQLKGALDFIQTKTSPATTAINTQVSNLAFSMNMANARMTFLATQIGGKEGKIGQGVIMEYQEKLKNLKNPTAADITALMEEFKTAYENAEAKMLAYVSEAAMKQGESVGALKQKQKDAKNDEYQKQAREDARQKGIQEGRTAENKRLSEIASKSKG